MKIEIKSLKHSPSLSEETNAYTATVWVDGKRAFHASNHGHGAGDDFHPLPDYDGPTLEEVNAYLAEHEPPEGPLEPDPAQRSGWDTGMACDLELLIGRTIEAKAMEKTLRRHLRQKVCLIGPDGKFYTLKARPTPGNLAAAAERYSDHTVLNDEKDESILARAAEALHGIPVAAPDLQEQVIIRLRENRLTLADARYLLASERRCDKPCPDLIERLERDVAAMGIAKQRFEEARAEQRAAEAAKEAWNDATNQVS